MTWTFFTKAVFAGLTVFIATVGAILVGDTVLADVTQGQWFFIAGAVLAAFGGVLGLQEAPATVATSIRNGGGGGGGGRNLIE